MAKDINLKKPQKQKNIPVFSRGPKRVRVATIIDNNFRACPEDVLKIAYLHTRTFITGSLARTFLVLFQKSYDLIIHTRQ